MVVFFSQPDALQRHNKLVVTGTHIDIAGYRLHLKALKRRYDFAYLSGTGFLNALKQELRRYVFSGSLVGWQGMIGVLDDLFPALDEIKAFFRSTRLKPGIAAMAARSSFGVLPDDRRIYNCRATGLWPLPPIQGAV